MQQTRHPSRTYPEAGHTEPGAVDSWVQLSNRFGKKSFADCFESAIRYAHDGFQVSPITARSWAAQAKNFAAFPDFLKSFCPAGRAPKIGERFQNPDQAQTLTMIAESKGEAFYHGSLAERIASASEIAGGALCAEDLAGHESNWVFMSIC